MKPVFAVLPVLWLVLWAGLGLCLGYQWTTYKTPLAGPYPNPTITPGVVNPDVTQDTIQQTICVHGWTATVRPGVSYTNGLKDRQIQQYGYADTDPRDYEEDHFIPLEVGGNPTDPQNLWPEPYNPVPGAHQKDHVENYLHDQVCAGSMTLADAQAAIVSDWVAVYQRIAPDLAGAQ